MDKTKSIQGFIRHAILQGRPREVIFNQACEIFCDIKCKIALELIKIWYRRRANDYVLPDDFCPIIEAIRREFRLSKHSVEGICCLSQRNYRCNIQMITERYALESTPKVDEYLIYVYDLWLGQRRFVYWKLLTFC
jgi:hypothetical protein